MRAPARFGHGAVLMAALACLALLATSQSSEAHPHILIQAKAEMLFNAVGQLIGVRNTWDFDDAFSAYAIQGYDSKGDGQPTREDLQPFAEINLKALAEYKYFTRLTLAGAPVSFAQPKDYYDVFDNEKLTLRFTLPTAQPLDVRGKKLELDVYDPEYFAAINFAPDKPIDISGAKAGCDLAIHRPDPLDAGTAAQLAAIPADQRELPPSLLAITDKLVNGTMVTCR